MERGEKAPQALALLREHPIFTKVQLAETDVAKLEVRTYDQDKVVARAGSPQSAVLVLVSGSVALHRRPSGASSAYLAGILQAPSMLGDIEMISGERWSSTAYTTRRSSFIEIPNELFSRLIGADSEIALAVFRSASLRALRLRRSLEGLLTQPVPDKLVALLWDLSRPGGAEGPIARVSQARLARALGVDRKTIGRNVARLVESGVLRVKGGDTTLLQDRRAADPRVARVGTWKISEYPRARGNDLT